MRFGKPDVKSVENMIVITAITPKYDALAKNIPRIRYQCEHQHNLVKITLRC